MSNVAIPNWNLQGVLPPINSVAPTSTDRSPYAVSLTDLVLRFGTSPDRQTIFTGFLKFRSALHAAGLVDGFQWVNGSFLEDIETTETRNPADIDIVTFYHLPDGETQETVIAAAPRLFSRTYTKKAYHVDAYFVHLNGNSPEWLVERSAYWYSMWSHRRNEQWKGYLQIGLSPADDPVAKANLDKKTNQGGQP
ncbi:MAG: hypothetical protein KAY37_02860 [Phycisphaerae bacterium]|nr:hypothetical protein [Phycisphaerae bacterium]